MAECPSHNTISQLIPVVGAVLGAAIGFFGALANTWLAQKNKEIAERQDRERIRIENLYETLLEIRKSYSATLEKMISKVHFGPQEVVPEANPSGISPLIRLDMLIRLYFPNLNETYKQFVVVKDRFSEALGNNIITIFTSKSETEKKEICGKYLIIFQQLDNEITNLQLKLADMIKV